MMRGGGWGGDGTEVDLGRGCVYVFKENVGFGALNRASSKLFC
jgi:hypothetical protein